MVKTYRIVLPVLLLWLFGWIFLSWPGIQDDALIHLRYADNLKLHHFITYDGSHASYGTSSLLYVGFLAFLRYFTHSPQLPRAVSSLAHIVLVSGLGLALTRRIPVAATLARLSALILLLMLVMPGADRWLDDGMETGLGLIFAGLLGWLTMDGLSASRPRNAVLTLVAFLAVLLRTEYLILCGLCFAILAAGKLIDEREGQWSSRNLISVFPASLAPLLGALLAVCFTIATMHSLLADTAMAKSHGWMYARSSLMQFVTVTASAFSFGVGMALLWLITFCLALRQTRRFLVPLLLANAIFPAVLVLSVLRGQEIQGIRYFAWTFFFSILWNIRELGRTYDNQRPRQQSPALLYGFLLLILLALPYESFAMHRVVTGRARNERVFESQHLEVLAGQNVVAQDVGFIGYFSQAQICDLSGLVNGRVPAGWSALQRLQACAALHPQIVFATDWQMRNLQPLLDISSWKVCGRYDYTNVNSPDRHYLFVSPALVTAACGAAGATPTSADSVLH